MAAVETSLAEDKGKTDPNDPQFLLSQLRALHQDAQRFLVWASLFGPTCVLFFVLCNTALMLRISFKIQEVTFMVHWEDANVGWTADDETEDLDLSKVIREHAQSSNAGRESMRGLQIAIQEGWLVQRGRELCSFAHDHYMHASYTYATAEWPVPKMSLRVSPGLLCLKDSK
jgi:hypothetical protein